MEGGKARESVPRAACEKKWISGTDGVQKQGAGRANGRGFGNVS